MNLEIITQLAVLTLVVVSGPLVIGLLAARRGNLWDFKRDCFESRSNIETNFLSRIKKGGEGGSS